MGRHPTSKDLVPTRSSFSKGMCYRWHGLAPEPWGLSWDSPTWTCHKRYMASQKCWQDCEAQMLSRPYCSLDQRQRPFLLWAQPFVSSGLWARAGSLSLEYAASRPDGLSRCFYFIIMIGRSRVNHFVLFKGDTQHWTSDMGLADLWGFPAFISVSGACAVPRPPRLL